MPKRQRDDNSYNHFRKKLKKLESELKKSRQKRCRIIESSSSSSSPSSREPSPVSRNLKVGTKPNRVTVSSPLSALSAATADPPDLDVDEPTEATDEPQSTAIIDGAEQPLADLQEPSPSNDIRDSILIEILGENPSTTEEYGPDIHKDLASRFNHLATTGLDLKLRKELTTKYPVPANCTNIAAPLLNAEIKAALPEAMLKRDKSLEARQNQLANAIACLSSAMTDQLNSKHIDQDLLKKLMDTARLLCDIQHTDSKTRRNFAMYSVKKDMKEHLSNTKQDKFLFGENLSETLKAAKAVNKSSTELKVPPPKVPKKITMQTVSKPPNKNLNWKSPAPDRRTPGPQRSRAPASRRSQPATTSRQSSPPQKTTRRR